LEEKVNSGQLAPEREKAFRFRISRLQEKIEFISARQASLGDEEAMTEQTPAAQPVDCKTEETEKPVEGWARRGKCGRRREGEEGWVPRSCRMNERLPPEIHQNFRQAKLAFQIAKEGGNREEIQAAKEAWIQAKQAKWAAKDELRAQKAGEDRK